MNGWKEINITAEIKEIKNQRKIQRISETKGRFFKINKIDQLLVKLRKTQINKTKNEKGDTIDPRGELRTIYSAKWPN